MALASRLKDPRLFRQQAYVDGGGTVDVDDPATGRKIGTVPAVEPSPFHRRRRLL